MTRSGFNIQPGSAQKAMSPTTNSVGGPIPKNIEPNRPIFERPRQEGDPQNSGGDEYDDEDEYDEEDEEEENASASKSFVVKLNQTQDPQ